MLDRRLVTDIVYVGERSKPPIPDLYKLTLEGEPRLVVWVEEDPDVLPRVGDALWLEWECEGDAALDPGSVRRVGVTVYVHLEGTGKTLQYRWRLGQGARLVPFDGSLRNRGGGDSGYAEAA